MPTKPTQPETAPATAHTPESLESARWPFPWHRHNTRILAANGAIVATLPSDIQEGETTVDAFTHQIVGIVERGLIFEMATSKMIRRRNDWLEQQNETLKQLIAQSSAHWTSVIAAEGTEFSNGAFDSVKDLLADIKTASDGTVEEKRKVFARYTQKFSAAIENAALLAERDRLRGALEEIKQVIGANYEPGQKLTQKHGYITAIIHKATTGTTPSESARLRESNAELERKLEWLMELPEVRKAAAFRESEQVTRESVAALKKAKAAQGGGS